MKPEIRYTDMEIVDKMTLPFTGVAGINTWLGYRYNFYDFEHENDVVTMPSSSYDMWDNTIRVKNHMNGDDVINTLSDGWGSWNHGMETTFLKISTGLLSNDKPELLEQQNYVSSDKSQFAGYVKNRSYNIRTRGCSNITFQILYAPQFYIPRSITWDAPPTFKRLKIDGLQNGVYYSVDWYSFKYGTYIETDCLKATNGKIRLEFPTLSASYSDTNDNPVLWFVAKKSSCDDSDSSDEDNLLDVTDEENYERIVENKLYPNPFEDYFMVNSQQADIFTLQSLDGTIIGKYKVGKGETRIAKILSSGLYIGRLQNQNQTFKIVKR